MEIGVVNTLDEAAFVSLLGGVFELSPWVAAGAHGAGPFVDVDGLHGAMMGAVRRAGPAGVLRLLRAHPELAGREAQAGEMTPESMGQQGRLGLLDLPADEFRALAALNAEYRARFGFPCIIALVEHEGRDTVFRAFRARMGSSREAELAAALDQVGVITRDRLAALVTPGLVDGPDYLSTHVLDLVHGRPAAGLVIELSGPDGTLLKRLVTDAEGRTAGPVLAGAEMAGPFRLLFRMGRYFRGLGASTGVFDAVPVDIVLAAGMGHVHVPLLASAHGYSTYRGG